MKPILLLLIFLYFQLGTCLFSEPKHTASAQPITPDSAHPLTPSHNALIINVHGLVCSFCAHGLKKSVSQFNWIDKSLYQDGVLVNVENGTLTIARNEINTIDLPALLLNIKKSGYQTHSLSFWISGKSSLIKDQLHLKSDAFTYPFIVTNAN